MGAFNDNWSVFPEILVSCANLESVLAFPKDLCFEIIPKVCVFDEKEDGFHDILATFEFHDN